MYGIAAAACGQEEAVAFLDSHGIAATDQLTLAIDGASEWKIFSNIMLPLGSNVTITLTIFSFMWRWNDYILPLLVLSDQKKYTIQIAIKNFIGNTGVDWSSILAASVLSILPIVILFVILQKYIVGGVSAGGVKG